MFRSRFVITVVAVAGAIQLTACVDDEGSIMDTNYSASRTLIPAPSGLQTIPVGNDLLTLWPYTSSDFGATLSDPINLIFRGHADPRSLRAALLALNGDRSALGFPNEYPFNCTWDDAHGDMQGAYGSDVGWTANVVQLACGNYGPLRFHLRLFPAGEFTIANAHFEVQIPGTADHQVLSWEIAKQLVTADFARTGLLDAAPANTGVIHQAPGFRTIPAVIYNGLPVELRVLLTSSPDAVTVDVPILTSGSATILSLGTAMPWAEGSTGETLTLTYDQIIPRPFCSSGPADYVYVNGPLTLTRTANQSSDGRFISELRTHGRLTITPVNPLDGTPIGESTTALINETHSAYIGAAEFHVSSMSTRKEIAVNGTERTGLTVRFQVGEPGTEQFSRVERCGK